MVEICNQLREHQTAAFEASLLLSDDILRKLGSWAAILAVSTGRAGIYGMNLKKHAGAGMVFRPPRMPVVYAGDLQYHLLLLSKAAWL